MVEQQQRCLCQLRRFPPAAQPEMMRTAEKDDQYASLVYKACREAFRHLFGSSLLLSLSLSLFFVSSVTITLPITNEVDLCFQFEDGPTPANASGNQIPYRRVTKRACEGNAGEIRDPAIRSAEEAASADVVATAPEFGAANANISL
ncbi:hypothetical protein Fmac_032397 [Flemingia macrophylla]|uniref:Uncharacterized protein n=1 Tax=Flemingia macrophylla TaxID=520843 RepID=A0ABD1L4R9_9FABA